MNARKKILFLLLSFALMGSTALADTGSRVRVFLAGDSTMQDVDHDKNPDWGWGQVFPRYFDENVEIVNLARGGRSTRTFLEEGRWETLIGRAGEGDYIIIQFGHNDGARDKPERYTSPEDYRKNLIRFVTEAREKGAIPILLTPVMRRNFDGNGEFVDRHGVYPSLVKEVAGEMTVTFIDLQEKSKWLIINHGVEGSKKIFMNVAPGEHPCCPEGRSDNTHFSEYGAMKVAGLVVEGLKEVKATPLADHLLIR